MSLRRWVLSGQSGLGGICPGFSDLRTGGNRPARRPQFCHQIPGGVESEQVYPCGTAQRRAAHPSFHHARTDRAGRCARIRTCAAPLSGVFRLNIRGCSRPRIRELGMRKAKGRFPHSCFCIRTWCPRFCRMPRSPVFVPGVRNIRVVCAFLRIMSKGHTNMSFKNIFCGAFPANFGTRYGYKIP